MINNARVYKRLRAPSQVVESATRQYAFVHFAVVIDLHDMSIKNRSARHCQLMTEDHTPRHRSPQEKKALSYAKDRRNAYGQNDKASRKAIPARKNGESRRVRRKANQTLSSIDRLAEESAEVSESSLNHDIDRIGAWKKFPYASLREFLIIQTHRRSARQKRKRRSAE